jgi:segregation and condensation protein A
MSLVMPTVGTQAPAEAVSSFASSAPAITLSVFEGPLDLLLHLIRQNEVEITDIPIAAIGQQYLSYLDAMQELNLDVVGEYLVMAATLAWIKSRMLLPPEYDSEDGVEVDPRAELVARLLEYQRFKEAALSLGDRHLLGRDVFDARTPDSESAPESEREVEVGLFELVRAFKEVLEAAVPTDWTHEVEPELVTVRERILVVMEILETQESVEFAVIARAREGAVASKSVVIATFLAILELTRLAAIRIYQGLDEAAVPEGPIHVRRAISPGDSSWRSLISDIM